MTVELKRRAAFSAGILHRQKHLSLEQNEELFTRLSTHGNGHNYAIEVTVAGDVDVRTGMVVNIVEIDRLLDAHVIEALGGKILNVDVPYFENQKVTVENISKFCWDHIEPVMPVAATLVSVRIWDSTTHWATRSRRENSMEVSVTRAYDFAASHRLHSSHLTDEENLSLFGKCNNPHGHGHNYGVEVTLSGEPDTQTGEVWPVENLDMVVGEEVLLAFDHKHLNYDTPEFSNLNPTSEMLSVVIWDKLAKRLPTTGPVRLSSVVVRETPRNSFEYRGR